MAAGASGVGARWGGMGLTAPLFRYLLECGARAAPKPTLRRENEPPVRPYPPLLVSKFVLASY